MRISQGTISIPLSFSPRSRAFDSLITTLIVCTLLTFFPGLAFAQTTDNNLGQGIGTFISDAFGDGSNVHINTSVAAVVYSNPVRVHRDGLHYFEVTGSIRGTGWGGEFADLTGPAPVLSANAHYSCDLPFVL